MRRPTPPAAGKKREQIVVGETWEDLQAVRQTRRVGIVKDQAELERLEFAMRRLAPLMALNLRMTVEEAVQKMRREDEWLRRRGMDVPAEPGQDPAPREPQRKLARTAG